MPSPTGSHTTKSEARAENATYGAWVRTWSVMSHLQIIADRIVVSPSGEAMLPRVEAPNTAPTTWMRISSLALSLLATGKTSGSMIVMVPQVDPIARDIAMHSTAETAGMRPVDSEDGG